MPASIPRSPIPERCTDTGVAAPLVGTIGSVQAMEVLKLLTGAGQTLEGRLLRLDALLHGVAGRPYRPRSGLCGVWRGGRATRPRKGVVMLYLGVCAK